jgi:rhodanese-related sulfurtransferase
MGLSSTLLGSSDRPYDGWVDVESLKAALNEDPAPLIVDVRNPEEFYGPFGHIPNAVNVPFPTFQMTAENYLNQDRPLVLVCQTDRRSRIAASLIHRTGRRDVLVLRGGMTAWRSKG